VGQNHQKLRQKKAVTGKQQENRVYHGRKKVSSVRRKTEQPKKYRRANVSLQKRKEKGGGTLHQKKSQIVIV